MNAMKSMIETQEVTFYYGEQGDREKALDRVSFSVEKGSFVAVIGKNGSGKSTLAKNLNALLLPNHGTVYVNGMDTSVEETLWEIRQRVGMVFQNPDNQLVSSIVEDDVAFGPENLGIDPDEIKARVEQSLCDVDMAEHGKKAPHFLSGGQKQRVAIAGAIAMRPECIVFDEPTAMLDPVGRKEVMAIIGELNQAGITCILITHFMEEAACARRILIMDQGRIVMDGSPGEIFRRHGELVELSLDVPVAVKLAIDLRKQGVDLPPHIIDERELIQALCQLK